MTNANLNLWQGGVVDALTALVYGRAKDRLKRECAEAGYHHNKDFNSYQRREMLDAAFEKEVAILHGVLNDLMDGKLPDNAYIEIKK